MQLGKPQRALARPVVAVFCMPLSGHFQRLRPVIAGLSARGCRVVVYSHLAFAPAAAAAGAEFVDLFTRYPEADADDRSIPSGTRFVSYAGHHLDAIAAELARLDPHLIVYDTFSVIGYVVARVLGVPSVNVCAGHNALPERLERRLRALPGVDFSLAQAHAERLARDHGIENATPFLFMATRSPDLNLYCEPEAFLSADYREVMSPLMCFGSLLEPQVAAEQARGRLPDDERREILVSFGTIAWGYFGDFLGGVLGEIADAVAERPERHATISLGDWDGRAARVRSWPTLHGADQVARLTRPNVRVERFTDQWAALRWAGVLFTHHGLNSTHEAIFHGVPMLSYPFMWDQPAQATTCQRLGLALPLVPELRGEVTRADVHAALDAVDRDRDRLAHNLAHARQAELDVMAGREVAFERMLELAGAPLPARA